MLFLTMNGVNQIRTYLSVWNVAASEYLKVELAARVFSASEMNLPSFVKSRTKAVIGLNYGKQL